MGVESNFINAQTVKQNINSMQITNDEMCNLSTKAIVEECLNYSHIADIFAYNSFDVGFNQLTKDFDGFKELLMRQDAAKELFAAVENMVNNVSVISYDRLKRGEFSVKCYLLASLLCLNEINQKLTDTEQQLYALSLKRCCKILIEDGLRGSLAFNAISFLHDKYAGEKKFLDSAVYQSVTRYTPKGSPVDAKLLLSGDYDNDTKTYLAGYVTSEYGVEVVSEATKAYNCHAYAWHMTEGNNNDMVWIGTDGTQEDVYWNDGSYFEVPESISSKVSYFGDHSAIRISSNCYQSKWGALPTVRHAPDNVPSGYAPYEQRRYYIRTPSIISSSEPYGIYSIQNCPNGGSVIWSFTRTSGATSEWVLQQDTPLTGQCTFTYTGSGVLMGTLSAAIYKNGILLTTVSRELSNVLNDFVGSYSYPATYLYTYYPAHDGFYFNGDTITVPRNCLVTLESDYFEGAAITKTGANLSQWNNDGNGTVQLKFRKAGGLDYVRINGNKNNYLFMFTVNAYDDQVMQDPILSYMKNDNLWAFSNRVIADDYDGKENKFAKETNGWQLVITNIITGQILYSESIVGTDTEVDTTLWPAGLYSAKIICNGETYTYKRYIGNNIK